MNRRRAIGLTVKGGVSVGLLAGLYGGHSLLPPRRSSYLEPVRELATRLFTSLDPVTRDLAYVDYDHAYRQYHNRGVGCGGVAIDPRRFNAEQRLLLTDLLHAGLSPVGQDRLPRQFFINWPGVYLMRLLFCGDPADDRSQIVISGPHLNLRLGGASVEGVAFGGPQVYGDQRGNERPGLPGNIYRYQLDIATELFNNLSDGEQREALLTTAPIQTQIELQGAGGGFPGVEVAHLAPQIKAQVGALVDGALSTYTDADVAFAYQCLETNGGIDRLFLSYYEDGVVGAGGPSQIVRLEGPAAVLYFRGAPHVHAFINIAMDGDRPLSVGEVVGKNPTVLEASALQRLFEAAIKAEAATDLALYPADSVVGKLREGTVRTGDVYNAESWQDTIAVVEIEGSDIAGELADQLRTDGVVVDRARGYTVATTSNALTERTGERLGRVGASFRRGMVRDATIAFLKRHGFGRHGFRPPG